jgi:hypothetical protein
MRKYLTIYEKAVSHICLCTQSLLISYEEILFSFFFSVCSSPFDRIQTKPPDLEVLLTARQGVSVSPAGVGDPAVLLHGGLVETVQEERSAFSKYIAYRL